MPTFACMGVALLQFLGIWFIKATTRTKPHSLPRRNRVNHADSSKSDMISKNLTIMLVYFQHTPKNYIQDIFPGSLLVVACHQFNFMIPDSPIHLLNYLWATWRVLISCLKSVPWTLAEFYFNRGL